MGDLAGEGLLDVVAQVEGVVHLLWNRGELSFEHEAIGKHPALRRRARPIALADLNGDGKLDIVGAPSTGTAIFLGTWPRCGGWSRGRRGGFPTW